MLNWKQMATKSKRFVFQLAPSARLTSGIGSGLLLAPRASEHEEDHARFVERMGDRTMNAFPTLSNQIKAMIPTPEARNSTVYQVANGKQYPRLGTVVGTSTGLKLQPAFAAWMMGFPEDWTESPFLVGGKSR